jgi:hypothetical protein
MRAAISVMLIVPGAERAIGRYQAALDARNSGTSAGVAAMTVRGAPCFLHEVNPANTHERSPSEMGATSLRVESLRRRPGLLHAAYPRGGRVPSFVEDHLMPWGPLACEDPGRE